MKKITKKIALLCIIVLLMEGVSIIETEPTIISAATKVRLNKKKATLTVGKTITLKVKGTKKKVKWSSSKKKVATVSSKGKVRAKKKGKVTITAKIGKKKYKCKITVKNKKVKPVRPVITAQQIYNNKVLLKNHILLKGIANTQGNKGINMTIPVANDTTIYTVGIIYESTTDRFQVICISEEDNISTTTSFYLDMTDKNISVEYAEVNNSMKTGFKATASLSASTYSRDKGLVFNLSDTSSYSDKQSSCNLRLGNAMVMLGVLLNQEIGVGIEEIGFTSFYQ